MVGICTAQPEYCSFALSKRCGGERCNSVCMADCSESASSAESVVRGEGVDTEGRRDKPREGSGAENVLTNRGGEGGEAGSSRGEVDGGVSGTSLDEVFPRTSGQANTALLDEEDDADILGSVKRARNGRETHRLRLPRPSIRAPVWRNGDDGRFWRGGRWCVHLSASVKEM